MTTTWTDANGVKHEIKTMPTPYIENCLSLIDDRLHTLITRLNRDGKRVAEAQEELKIKQEQKAEMLRTLHERRRASISNTRNEQSYQHTCYTCKHGDTVLNQLICKKLNNFCSAVKFTCGAWERL